MVAVTRTIDAKARLVLPKSFANVTVVIEQISDSEIRIRRAKVMPKDELSFAEESSAPLSDRDRDLFLKLLAKPLASTSALKKVASRHNSRRG